MSIARMPADGVIIVDILNLIGRFFKFGMETEQFPMILARAEEMGHHVPHRFKKSPYLTVSVGNGLSNRCAPESNRVRNRCGQALS
jgi:hypothetical protein